MLNASWKISCLAVNGQSFLVIDGYLLNYYFGPNVKTLKIKDINAEENKRAKITGAYI